MEVQQVDISSITPYEGNPRRNRNSVGKVADSLKAYGWRQPIVVDEDMVIIAGHTRLLAAKRLKMKEVPIHVAVGLSPEQVRAYRLMDNRSGEDSAWIDDLLKTEIVSLLEDGFDISLTGFNGEELNLILADGHNREGEDEIPEPGPAITKTGDLWILGDHRLLCGDATIAGDVERVLNGVKPHLMVTDPPYGVEYDADWRNHTNVLGRADRAVGKVQNDSSADWRKAWALFPGDVIYAWCAPGPLQITAFKSLLESGFEPRVQIIWAKNNIVIGRGHYHAQFEPCWYAVRKGSNGHWSGSRKESTLWHIDKPMKSETGHSTQKPVECMRRPIQNNSSPGQVVYDPFLGSGTTIIAAQTEGRHCYGLEIEPAYCDIIVKRWEQFTDQEAVRDQRV